MRLSFFDGAVFYCVALSDTILNCQVPLTLQTTNLYSKTIDQWPILYLHLYFGWKPLSVKSQSVADIFFPLPQCTIKSVQKSFFWGWFDAVFFYLNEIRSPSVNVMSVERLYKSPNEKLGLALSAATAFRNNKATFGCHHSNKPLPWWADWTPAASAWLPVIKSTPGNGTCSLLLFLSIYLFIFNCLLCFFKPVSGRAFGLSVQHCRPDCFKMKVFVWYHHQYQIFL